MKQILLVFVIFATCLCKTPKSSSSIKTIPEIVKQTDTTTILLKGSVKSTHLPAFKDFTVYIIKDNIDTLSVQTDSLGYFYYRLERQAEYTIFSILNLFKNGIKVKRLAGIVISNPRVKISTKNKNPLRELSVELLCDVFIDPFPFPTIHFKKNSTDFAFLKGNTEMTNDTIAINNIADYSKDLHPMILVITGHSDTRGYDSLNLKLSFKRAEKVKYYLVEKGVSPESIIIQGKGKQKPIISEERISKMTSLSSIDSAHQVNRRVNFNIKFSD